MLEKAIKVNCEAEEHKNKWNYIRKHRENRRLLQNKPRKPNGNKERTWIRRVIWWNEWKVYELQVP